MVHVQAEVSYLCLVIDMSISLKVDLFIHSPMIHCRQACEIQDSEGSNFNYIVDMKTL